MEREVEVHENGYSFQGEDGPVSIVLAECTEESSRQWEEKLAEAAAQIKPCGHTIRETEYYITEKYHAAERSVSPEAVNNLKYEIITEEYPELVEPIPELNVTAGHPDEAQLQLYVKELDAWRKKITDYSDEKIVMDVHEFSLFPEAMPGDAFIIVTERNHNRITWTYSEPVGDGAEQQGCGRESASDRSDPGYGDIVNDILAFFGVTEEDIAARNSRFLRYMTTVWEKR